MAAGIENDMIEFARNIDASLKSKKFKFKYNGKLNYDSLKSSHGIIAILNSNKYRLHSFQSFFYSKSLTAQGKEEISLAGKKENDFRNINFNVGKNLISTNEIFIINIIFKDYDYTSGNQHLGLFYTFDSNNINETDAKAIVDKLKDAYATSVLKLTAYPVLLDSSSIDIYPKKGLEEKTSFLSKASSWAGSVTSFMGKNLKKGFKNLWVSITKDKKYRYKWILFNSEEDYLYCELLSRYPHANPAHKYPMETSVKVKNPEGGIKEFIFSEMFRVRSRPLETDKLKRKNVEIMDNPRFSDMRTLKEELAGGKVLGLGVANAVEGSTFWSIVLRPFGLKGKKIDFDPNELFWKWTKYTSADLDDANVEISGKVIEVKGTESDAECSSADIIENAEVFVYETKKDSSNKVEILNQIGPNARTNEKGEFNFSFNKKDINGKQIIIIAKKSRYKESTVTPKFTIIKRPLKRGTHLDNPCGAPDDIILIESATSKVENIIVPLKKGSGGGGGITAPFILLFDENKEGVLSKKGIVKVDPRDEIKFIINSDNKNKKPVPEEFKLGLFCYDKNGNLFNAITHKTWQLFYNDKPTGEDYILNTGFNNKVIKKSAITKYAIESTEIKKELLNLANTKDEIYTLIAVLVNTKNLDMTKFNKERDWIYKDYKSFLNYAEKNSNRVIYDFQTVIIDPKELVKSVEFEKYIKVLKKVTEAMLKKNMGQWSLNLKEKSNDLALTTIINIIKKYPKLHGYDIEEVIKMVTFLSIKNWETTNLGKPIKEIIDTIKNSKYKKAEDIINKELLNLKLNVGIGLKSVTKKDYVNIKVVNTPKLGDLTNFKPVYFFKFIKFILKQRGYW